MSGGTRSPSVRRFCRDCRWINVQGNDYAAATCLAPRLQHAQVDLVSGKVLAPAPYLCSYARGKSTLCSITARFFILKAP